MNFLALLHTHYLELFCSLAPVGRSSSADATLEQGARTLFCCCLNCTRSHLTIQCSCDVSLVYARSFGSIVFMFWVTLVVCVRLKAWPQSFVCDISKTCTLVHDAGDVEREDHAADAADATDYVVVPRILTKAEQINVECFNDYVALVTRLNETSDFVVENGTPSVSYSITRILYHRKSVLFSHR